MFNNYFGKTVQYEEIYVDNNELKYKSPVTIKGSDIRNKSTQTNYEREFLKEAQHYIKRSYRLPIEVQIGSKIDGARVQGCWPRGFGSRIDFYLADTIDYSNIIIVKDDLTVECLVEHKVGIDALRNPIYSEPEVVKTWYFDNREIYRPSGDTITSHTARAYIFLPSVNLQRGDKIDGYIVEEIDIKHNVDGSINHIEAYICVSKGAMHLNSE